MSFRADLHCHTTCSDGSLTPQELVALAKESGLSGLSVTDHDTIDAYETLIPEARRLGILLGAGVEFSCEFKGKSVHILGYDFRLDSPEIRAFCERHQKRREERNRAILAKLSRIGLVIGEQELPSAGTVGRPHIAHLMVKKGYVSSFKEAFQLYLGEGKRCYDEGVTFSAQEGVDVIHQGGGKAFVAHPHLLSDGGFIRELLTLPFDGIECHYARCSPEKERRWLKIAKEKGLLISGGSDFHGALKEHIPLGSSWVDEECFHKIFQKPLC
jgi:predicted metal-dependent phosphoesterase TrpH